MTNECLEIRDPGSATQILHFCFEILARLNNNKEGKTSLLIRHKGSVTYRIHEFMTEPKVVIERHESHPL